MYSSQLHIFERQGVVGSCNLFRKIIPITQTYLNEIKKNMVGINQLLYLYVIKSSFELEA